MLFQLLIDHEEAVAPDPNDPLHEILKELGPSPTVESLLGECGRQSHLKSEEKGREGGGGGISFANIFCVIMIYFISYCAHIFA